MESQIDGSKEGVGGWGGGGGEEVGGGGGGVGMGEVSCRIGAHIMTVCFMLL